MYLVFVVIFLIVYILINFLCYWIFNRDKSPFILRQPISKYRLADNYVYGNRLDPTADGNLNCTANDKLIECDLDDNNELGRDAVCAQCKQISARCVNIREPIYRADDPSRVLIEPNSSPTKGYCLPSKTIETKCTRRNGGKWILSTVGDSVSNATARDLVYTFECYCSTPNFFQTETIGADSGDCTRFVGCRHGKLESDTWSSYEDMRCLCPTKMYEAKIGSANEPPSCVPLNVYRRVYDNADNKPPFEILSQQYIDPDYLVLLRGGGNSEQQISLPNPCTFDVTTKTFIRGIGRVVWDSTAKIAFCMSSHENYTTVIMNDDYLIGNGGKYANAMFRYRISTTDESNDDADDNMNRYENATVYEVLRKGARVRTLSGVRIPYWNFTVYLPYLETNSYNMGNGSGRHYATHPIIPFERQRYTFVYVYQAEVPDHRDEIVLGNGIQYIPAFMTTSFESSYRVYNGTIPCINVSEQDSGTSSVRRFWILYPTPPGAAYKTKLGTTGIMGELTRPNVESDRFTAGYSFHFAHDNEVEPYTDLFTGTIFTYTLNKKVYSRPVSPGDELLVSKYRRNYDPQWINRPRETIKGYSPSQPFQFALTGRDTHMFTRNSYDVERNGVGVAKQKIARYEFDKNNNNRLVFKTFYS
ncbi:pif-1 [Musca domestica salivary gland hypertrophy virus]|uniref:Pif-1 n=10 Tax=Musca hytrovirus(isolate Musca domestica/United States/Boucias/-) TaxID=523909 RepID=B2YG06_MHVB|nr:pif-1 [Musca domestica salivary gland hypertrophy virus]ACD03488.1 pif-1 [Musca domestica salivary gland hypertrophy virus]